MSDTSAVEEQVEGSEVDETQTDDTGVKTETPDDASKKNKSNWKALSQKVHDSEARATKAEQELEEAQAEIAAWRTQNEEVVKEFLSKKNVNHSSEGKLALFLVNNLDAKEHLQKINEFMEETGMKDIEKAWKYVKATLPKESEDKNDFKIWNRAITPKKDLSKVSMEEIYSKVDGSNEFVYSKEQRSEWRKLNNK